MIAFDTKLLGCLVNEESESEYTSEFPLFYRMNWNNKVSTAFDFAIDAYKVKSLNILIWYICKYQNSMRSSYLVIEHFSLMLSMGLDSLKIFNSNIIFESVEFPEWPQNHPDGDKAIRPYNGSAFQLRKCYREVFPQQAQHDQTIEELQNSKSYKIKYWISALPDFILTDMAKEDHMILDELA